MVFSFVFTLFVFLAPAFQLGCEITSILSVGGLLFHYALMRKLEQLYLSPPVAQQLITAPFLPMHVRATAAAFASTAIIFFVSTVVVMAVLPAETIKELSARLLYGFDLAPLLRPEVGITDRAISFAHVAVLGWFFGALVASVYNWQAVSYD